LVWRLLAEHHSCRELGLSQETFCARWSTSGQLLQAQRLSRFTPALHLRL